jgi:hypothetical protein
LHHGITSRTKSVATSRVPKKDLTNEH